METEGEQRHEKKAFIGLLKAIYRWSYWILLTVIVVGSIIYKEWIKGALFLSMAISSKVIRGTTRYHRIAAILLLIVVYALTIAYFYTKARK